MNMSLKPDVLVHFQCPTNSKGAPIASNGQSYFIACDSTRPNNLVTGVQFNESMTTYLPAVNCVKCRKFMGVEIRPTDIDYVPRAAAIVSGGAALSSKEASIVDQIRRGEFSKEI